MVICLTFYQLNPRSQHYRVGNDKHKYNTCSTNKLEENSSIKLFST